MSSWRTKRKASSEATGSPARKKQKTARSLLSALSKAATPSRARTGGYSFQSVGGTELNFVDTYGTNTFGIDPHAFLLNGVATGNKDQQRVGRQIRMKSIEVIVSTKSGLTTAVSGCRWAIVLDKQPNAQDPTIIGDGGVWDYYDVNAGSPSIVSPTTMRNISGKPRYWVLHDSGPFKVIGNFTLGNAATPTYPQSYAPTDMSGRYDHWYKRINIPVQYNQGDDASIGSIQSNALYFMTFGDTTTGGTADPDYEFKVRVRYTDQ